MRPILVLVFSVLVSAGSLAAAQPAVLLDPVSLRPEGLSEYAEAGFSVALTEDFAFVGAPADTVGPPRFPESPRNRTGAVYVFSRKMSGWWPETRLTGSDLSVSAYQNGAVFGWTAAALKAEAVTTLLVGAPYWNGSGSEGNYNGTSYLFQFDSFTERWIEQTVLRPTHIQPNETVGSSVSLVSSKFGLVSVLGAPGYIPAGGRWAGRAYVFTQEPTTSVWTEAGALDNCFLPDQATGGPLGESVAAVSTPTGVVVAVAGRIFIDPETMSSAVCVYRRDDQGDAPGPWTLDATLRPDPPDQNGPVRVSVTLTSTDAGALTLVLGRLYGNRAYVYQAPAGTSDWTQTQTLSEPGGNDFGTSLAVGQVGGTDVLSVGASFDSRFGPNAGAGYLYGRVPGDTSYSLRAILGSRENLDFQEFGRATAVSSSGWVAMTTPGRVPPDNEGRTYLYDVSSLFPVAAEAPPVAAGSRLAVAGANPARLTSAVTYTLDAAGPVEVAVFDALGREVARVASGGRGAGVQREAFSVSGLPAGVYVVRLVAGARRESVRLVVAR